MYRVSASCLLSQTVTARTAVAASGKPTYVHPVYNLSLLADTKVLARRLPSCGRYDSYYYGRYDTRGVATRDIVRRGSGYGYYGGYYDYPYRSRRAYLYDRAIDDWSRPGLNAHPCRGAPVS